MTGTMMMTRMRMKTRKAQACQEDKMKTTNKKAQQFGSILLVIALITSVFAVGMYTGDSDNKITAAVSGIESITGFDVYTGNSIEIEFEEDDFYFFEKSREKGSNVHFKFVEGEWKWKSPGKGYNDWLSLDDPKVSGLSTQLNIITTTLKSNKNDYDEGARHIQKSVNDDSDGYLIMHNDIGGKETLDEKVYDLADRARGDVKKDEGGSETTTDRESYLAEIKARRERLKTDSSGDNEIDMLNREIDSLIVKENSALKKSENAGFGTSTRTRYEKQADGHKKKRELLQKELEYRESSISEVLTLSQDSSNPVHQKIAKEVLEDKIVIAVKDEEKTEIENLLKESGGKEAFFAVANKKEVKEYINKDSALSDEYKIFTQKEGLVKGLTFNKEDGYWHSDSGEIFEVVVGSDLKETRIKIGGEAESETASSVSTVEEKKTLEKIKGDVSPEGYKIIKTDSLLLAEKEGIFYKIKREGTKYVVDTSKPALSPSLIKTDSKEFKKFEKFLTDDGKNVYEDSDGKVYSQADLNNALKKDDKIKTSKEIESKDGKKYELEKSLLMGEDGKPTTDIATPKIKIGDKQHEIDTETFESLENINKDSLGKVSFKDNKVKLEIGNIIKTLGYYSSNDAGERTGFIRKQVTQEIFEDKNGKPYTQKEKEKLTDEEKKDLNLDKAKAIKRIIRDETDFFKDNNVEKTAVVLYRRDKDRVGAETIVTDNKGNEVYYYAENKEEKEDPEIKFNDKGELLEVKDTYVVTFNEKGEPEKCIGCSSTEEKEIMARANTKQNQYSSRKRFALFESILTDFSGFGALNLLFRDEEWYFNWREGVDRAFAELYLGEEYWTSAVCA
ncbi:MAG: hypothetical protein QGH34_00705, partial [Candidatus Woesearchaeota archaeon]|nr:hypothetical protein [Candidatus Woesearchaeota archaeon]